MKTKDRIWTITDNIVGNANQALALADNLKINYKNIYLEYNIFSNLPNIIKGQSIIGLTESSKQLISAPFPELIISSGRKTASVARYIKSKNPSVKLVHILWPESGIKEFDMILTPYHDNYKANNIINIEGAISKITPPFLNAEKEKWMHKFFEFRKPLISLLIGGDTKKGEFKLHHAKELISKVNSLAKKLGASLMVSTSRRTSSIVTKNIKELIEVPYYFYNFDSNEDNPYIGFLACSDAIIVTGDSISMCTDCCSSGKPVFIYKSESFITQKHNVFLENLFNKKHASNLLDIDHINFDDEYYPLDNNSNLTKIIKERFL